MAKSKPRKPLRDVIHLMDPVLIRRLERYQQHNGHTTRPSALRALLYRILDLVEAEEKEQRRGKSG